MDFAAAKLPLNKRLLQIIAIIYFKQSFNHFKEIHKSILNFRVLRWVNILICTSKCEMGAIFDHSRWELKTKIIIPVGHFRVPPGLCIKTRLNAQPLIWKWFSFSCKWNSFSQERLFTWPHFESGSSWNSEVDYSMKHLQIQQFLFTKTSINDHSVSEYLFSCIKALQISFQPTPWCLLFFNQVKLEARILLKLAIYNQYDNWVFFKTCSLHLRLENV